MQLCAFQPKPTRWPSVHFGLWADCYDAPVASCRARTDSASCPTHCPATTGRNGRYRNGRWRFHVLDTERARVVFEGFSFAPALCAARPDHRHDCFPQTCDRGTSLPTLRPNVRSQPPASSTVSRPAVRFRPACLARYSARSAASIHSRNPRSAFGGSARPMLIEQRSPGRCANSWSRRRRDEFCGDFGLLHRRRQGHDEFVAAEASGVACRGMLLRIRSAMLRKTSSPTACP